MRLEDALAAGAFEPDLSLWEPWHPEQVTALHGGLNPERWGDMSPIHRARDMRGPVLGLYGGADPGIPPEQVEALERGLSEAGVEHEIVTYPGAPHSFFDRRFEEHARACEDAWRRVLTFLA